jgi:hypothetical protein
MEPYQNRSGRSGIIAYQIFEDSILVVFKSGKYKNYLYTYSATGKNSVEHMKKLATDGMGLNAYISSVVKGNYEEKW